MSKHIHSHIFIFLGYCNENVNRTERDTTTSNLAAELRTERFKEITGLVFEAGKNLLEFFSS